ncbi:MAG: signal peptide peptidase SppA [Acidimicrobiales bacterium]
MQAVKGFARLKQRTTAPYLLELDLSQPLLEDEPTELPARLLRRRRASLPLMLRVLRDATDDPKVCGLVAKVGPRAMGLAQAQEVRDAVAAFCSSGKPAVAWSETFGEFSAATVPYYLASGFDEIWLQPSGEVGFVGIASGSLFLAEALDRAGVRRQISTRHEYKSAANIFLERSFTKPQREAARRVVTSLFDQVTAGVASSRHLPEQVVRDLADRAPVPASEALEAGLVDHLGYRDEVYAYLRRRTGPATKLLFAHRYRRRRPVSVQAHFAITRRRSVVALVTGNGRIRLGRGAQGPFPAATMGSDTVCAALRAALEDERVRAVVFRVNSPGGSYVASDAIWREVKCLKDAGKPVVVSMADVAASGGYFVSAPADVIVAQPGTLTGSIGVLGGKFSLGDLLNRLGIGHDAVTVGRHARMTSPFVQFTEDEWRKLSEWLDRVYDDFISKVATGRSMTKEAVHEVARGRVWTGADAQGLGLVDELGGLNRALALARSRAGLPASSELVRFPRTSPLQQLRAPRSSEDNTAAVTAFGSWEPFSALAARLGLPPAGPLTMAPLDLGQGA